MSMSAAASPTVRALQLVSYLSLTAVGVCGLVAARSAMPLAVWWSLVALMVAGAIVNWFQRVGRLAPVPPPLVIAGLMVAVVVPAVLISSFAVILQAGVVQALAGLVTVKAWSVRRARDEREWQVAEAMLLVYSTLVCVETPVEISVLLGVGLAAWIAYAAAATLVAWFRESTAIVSLNDEVEDLVPTVTRLGALLAVAIVASFLIGGTLWQLRRAVPIMVPAQVWRAVERNLVDYYSHFSPVGLQERDRVERLASEEARLEQELRALEESTAMIGDSRKQFAQMVPQRVAERTAWLGPERPTELPAAGVPPVPPPPVEPLADVEPPADIEPSADVEPSAAIARDAAETSADARARRRWWFWLLLGTTALIVALTGLWRWGELLSRRQVAQRDPRQHVIWLYQETVRAGAWCGYPKPPAATPTEYAMLVQARQAGLRDSIATLVNLFHEARFSRHPITASHVERTRAMYRALRSAWRTGIPWWRRWVIAMVTSG